MVRVRVKVRVRVRVRSSDATCVTPSVVAVIELMAWSKSEG